MSINLETTEGSDLRREVVPFLKSLRERIIIAFEEFEPQARFERKNWEHNTGGGGEIALMRGEVFERAAVNWSGVSGEKFPTEEVQGPFFATGVSLITHMTNPHLPTVHMNVRYIQGKDRGWFGGGFDLTPMGFACEEDTRHFHNKAKECLDPHGEKLYTQFSQQAKEYFYIPHRKKERGVGGIFFDHWNSGNLKRDLKMWKAVGEGFLDAVIPLYKRKVDLPYTCEQKERQLIHRAHYVEFNLLYDRGTKFGFLSGGNPEAILCSMPPCAKW